MRIILYLGKGGVGKTTTAAATAVRSAALGYKTLIASTDIAHSLADSLDAELDSKPKQIADNLWAQEISVTADIHQHWDVLQNFVSGMVKGNGLNSVVADELSSFPGMDEIVSLLHINKQANEQNFDRLIIDAAPTGETIRLLTMPDTFRWYAGHLKSSKVRVAKAVSPIVGRWLKQPTALLEALSNLDEATGKLRQTLSNPEISSYRVVVNPEKMVVREAQRAVSYLGLFNYPVDAVVVNRVMAESANEGNFYQQKYEQQQKYIKYIQDSFKPLPLFYAPYYAHEVVGQERLSQLATDTFAEADPADVFFKGKLQEIIEAENDTYILRIPLPFVTGDDVQLRKRGDELFLTVGNFKREMILPSVLAKRKTGRGKLSDGMLEIEFLPVEEVVES